MNIKNYLVKGYVGGQEQPLVVLTTEDEYVEVPWVCLPAALQKTLPEAWSPQHIPIGIRGDRLGIPRAFHNRGNLNLTSVLTYVVGYKSPITGAPHLRKIIFDGCTMPGTGRSTVWNNPRQIEVTAPYNNLVVLSLDNARLLRDVIGAWLRRWRKCLTDSKGSADPVTEAYQLFLKRGLMAEAASFATPPVQYFLLYVQLLTEVYNALPENVALDYAVANDRYMASDNVRITLFRSDGTVTFRTLLVVTFPNLPNLFTPPRKPLPDMLKEVYKMSEAQIKFVKKKEVR